MIVDAHTHSWARRGCYQHLIRELDAAGVAAAVVVSAALAGNPGNNEYVAAAVAACPGRLYQFADVDSRWSKSYHRSGAVGRLAALAEERRAIYENVATVVVDADQRGAKRVAAAIADALDELARPIRQA